MVGDDGFGVWWDDDLVGFGVVCYVVVCVGVVDVVVSVVEFVVFVDIGVDEFGVVDGGYEFVEWVGDVVFVELYVEGYVVDGCVCGVFDDYVECVVDDVVDVFGCGVDECCVVV